MVQHQKQFGCREGRKIGWNTTRYKFLHETLDSLPRKYLEWNVEMKNFDLIVRSMKSLAATHMPLRKYTRREYKLKLKPWMTQGITSSVKHRDCLFRIYKRSNYLQISNVTKKFRNHLTHVKELAKRKYYEEQFFTYINSKRTWMFGKNKPSSFPKRYVDGRVY